MTPAAIFLRDEILRAGPVPFRRFMDVALFHPEYGYYRRSKDPFGKTGDYYTAEQLQPVFGILIGAKVRRMFEDLGKPADFTVVELGAGRGEMASAFTGFRYCPVEIDSGDWPEKFTGVVFTNEFFDALPADLAVRRDEIFHEVLVGWQEGRFAWTDGGPAGGEMKDYLDRYAPSPAEGNIVEVNLEALGWIERIAARLERGYVFTIDYGYTVRERARFTAGSLMSYRKHLADEDVLAAPGEKDITAHVCFTALEEQGKRFGLETVRFETLARTLLDAGEPDQFSAALAAASPEEVMKRRLQLKTLLYGMGESFRVLIQCKRAGQ